MIDGNVSRTTNNRNRVTTTIYIMVINEELVVNIEDIRNVILESYQFRGCFTIVLCLYDGKCSLASNTVIGHGTYTTSNAGNLSPQE